jgi:molybdate transport system substrate-binding protein
MINLHALNPSFLCLKFTAINELMVNQLFNEQQFSCHQADIIFPIKGIIGNIQSEWVKLTFQSQQLTRDIMGTIFQAIFSFIFALILVAPTVNANSQISDTKNIAASGPLTVAVASNFKYTSKQNVRLVTGSSGVLYAQIMKGAPFDVFLSADTQRPNNLVRAGLGKNVNVYAIGRLVLWPVSISSTNVEDPQHLQASYLTHLNNFEGKLAIANPQLAPFGKAALEVIENVPALEYLTHQLVKGTNINQAFQFVDSGNAQAGMIAESLLIQASQLLGTEKYNDYILIPRSQYTTIEQSIVVLNPSTLHPKSELFVNFLLNEHSQNILSKYGYDRP